MLVVQTLCMPLSCVCVCVCGLCVYENVCACVCGLYMCVVHMFVAYVCKCVCVCVVRKNVLVWCNQPQKCLDVVQSTPQRIVILCDLPVCRISC